MSRDWQRDMNTVIRTKERTPRTRTCCDSIGQIYTVEAPYVALEYWLQQYSAEKERADKLEKRNRALMGALVANANGTFTCLAEDREQKLREAIEGAMPDMLPITRILLKRTIDSLYPKEEAK